MSEEVIRGRDDIMIQGDVGESMRLEEAEGEGLHQHIREAGTLTNKMFILDNYFCPTRISL